MVCNLIIIKILTHQLFHQFFLFCLTFQNCPQQAFNRTKQSAQFHRKIYSIYPKQRFCKTIVKKCLLKTQFLSAELLCSEKRSTETDNFLVRAFHTDILKCNIICHVEGIVPHRQTCFHFSSEFNILHRQTHLM